MPGVVLQPGLPGAVLGSKSRFGAQRDGLARTPAAARSAWSQRMPLRWRGRPAVESRAAPEAAETTGRGEDWRIEAEASPAPTEGHALEQALSEQVEGGPAGGVTDDLAQTSARETLALQPVAVRRRRKKRGMQQVLPVVEAPKPLLSEGVRAGLFGVGALALLALGYIAARKLLSAQLPKVQKALEAKQLQKEAAQRLNVMIDELRNASNADLSAKNLGDEGTAYIAEGLAFNDRCTAADLSKNGIGVAGVTALAEALSHNEALQTLSLDTNSVGDEGAEVLAKHLSGDARMRRLNLCGNNIGDRGATLLAEMLKMNTTLTALELNGNNIDYDGATALAEALTQNTSLAVLHLSDNYIGPLGASVLANALGKNRSLRELHLKGNELGNEGVTAVCNALKERQAPITSLDFGNNNITLAGAEAIADIARRAHLKDLNLYMNDIGDAGILKLADALKGDNTLTSLDVGGNNIGPEGITALANALRGNDALRTLELGYNPIKEKGAQALADVVKYDLQVETLKMGWCHLGPDDGAKAVADLLMFNSTLVVLDLRGNGLGNAGASQLARALKEHTNDKLTELDLGYNEIKDEGACTLAQALKANPECAPRELKVNANYIGRFGQVALTEALDMVYDLAQGREITITY